MRKSILFISSLTSLFLLVGAGCITFAENTPTSGGPAGMYVSSDRGENWQKISQLPTENGVGDISSVSVYRLIGDPQDSSAMYWGSRERGLFFTFNNGKSWQRAPSPLDTGFIYSIAVHPKEKCTTYVTNGRFVYKSTDCSRSWSEVYRHSGANGKIQSLAISPFGDQPVYMLFDTGFLFQSTDQGTNWKVMRQFESGMKEIIVDQQQADRLYAVHVSAGLYRSDNAGNSWKKLSKGLSQFSGALDYRGIQLHPYKLNNILWVSDYGINFSEDAGESWKSYQLLTAPGSVKIYGFAMNPQNDKEIYYTATVGTRSTLYRTLDSGKTWTTKRLPSGQVPTEMRVHPKFENIIYVGFTIPPSS